MICLYDNKVRGTQINRPMISLREVWWRYSKTDGDIPYTITVKNLSDNSIKTYTDIKEFSGIAVSSSYSSYSNQRYEN